MLDLDIFKSGFDPHHRNRRVLNVIKDIQTNPIIGPENKKHLLAFANRMIEKVKKGRYRIGSLEKNLSEARNITLFIKTDLAKATDQEFLAWFTFHEKRYNKKEIKFASLEKYVFAARCLLQSVEGLKEKETPERPKTIEVPKEPDKEPEDNQTTQQHIKKLLETVYVEGKRYTIRDRAILALLNDTGARISEALSIQNKHVRQEKNHLVVRLPISKTKPRTVISFLAKPHLEAWAKVSPNNDKGPEAYFFCDKNGNATTYAAVNKTFKQAIKKSGIPWKPHKGVHYFRSLCASRFFRWPYGLKNTWFGWTFKNEEGAYSNIPVSEFAEQYFDTLKRENNPMLREDEPFWSDGEKEHLLLEKLMERDDFRVMLRELYAGMMK